MEGMTIRQVQIFGERCSGTNYLAGLVRENFANVAITREFGGKHWFVKGLDPRGRPNETTDRQCVRPLDDSDDTLFLVIHRNPYDWVRSIQATPYHAWDHDSLPLGEFIRKPWMSKEVSAVNPNWLVRDDGYYFIEDAPNVLELRTLKLRHLFRLAEVVANVAVIRYDDLAADPTHMAEIARDHGIELRHDRVANVDTYFGGREKKIFDGGRRYDPIDDADLDFINRTLDWDVESSAGYSPSDYRG